MASVVIQGDTSGSVTLQAPAVAGSTTVNLPSTIGNAGTSAVVTTDASGNAGIGVTPSAWDTTNNRRAFELGYLGSGLYTYAQSNTVFSANAYFNGGFKYAYTGFAASCYAQVSGEHRWNIAPSGTAGNAITFTQAMTLDASGNLGVGTTTPTSTYSSRLALVPAASVAALSIDAAAANNTSIIFYNNAVIKWATQVLTTGEYRWYDYTASAERARITSGGEFYVAGTTDQGAYNIQCNGTGVWGAGAYVNGSDARIKDDIKPLPSSLSVVQNLNPVTFRYKKSWSKDTSVQPGFIAQELQQALAGQEYIDGVVMQGPEYMSVAYQTLIPVLTKAIQEQQALIEQLTTRIAALEAK